MCFVTYFLWISAVCIFMLERIFKNLKKASPKRRLHWKLPKSVPGRVGQLVRGRVVTLALNTNNYSTHLEHTMETTFFLPFSANFKSSWSSFWAVFSEPHSIPHLFNLDWDVEIWAWGPSCGQVFTQLSAYIEVSNDHNVSTMSVHIRLVVSVQSTEEHNLLKHIFTYTSCSVRCDKSGEYVKSAVGIFLFLHSHPMDLVPVAPIFPFSLHRSQLSTSSL
jgi:hypothetical protein